MCLGDRLHSRIVSELFQFFFNSNLILTQPNTQCRVDEIIPNSADFQWPLRDRKFRLQRTVISLFVYIGELRTQYFLSNVIYCRTNTEVRKNIQSEL